MLADHHSVASLPLLHKHNIVFRRLSFTRKGVPTVMHVSCAFAQKSELTKQCAPLNWCNFLCSKTPTLYMSPLHPDKWAISGPCTLALMLCNNSNIWETIIPGIAQWTCQPISAGWHAPLKGNCNASVRPCSQWGMESCKGVRIHPQPPKQCKARCTPL